MNASVDGRILGSRWRPAENRMPGLFERLHEQLGGGSWLIDRVTGSESAKAKAYPDRTDQTYPREMITTIICRSREWKGSSGKIDQFNAKGHPFEPRQE
jgi:hypothetical protein